MLIETLQFQRGAGWSAAMPALDGPNTLVLVFGASSYGVDPAPLVELQNHYPHAVIAGCSTSGEVRGDDISDDTLSVAIARFETTRLRLATASIAGPSDSERAGRDLATQLLDDDLQGVVVLSDGLLVNGTGLVRGLAEVLPANVSVTGGLAGDGSRFEQTWVVAGDRAPSKGLIAAVGFYGERVRIGHGSRGGWDTFGPERTVTRSEGNVVFELDGKPALALYKDYLGDRAAGLPATALLFPLSIRPEGQEESLVRTILAVDEVNQSMTFAGDVPEGCNARLMKANFDRLIDGAATAAQQTRREDETAVSTLAIAVSCVGRRLVLGERTEEELEATLDGLPPDTSMVGFYSYGEISPFAGGTCELHNQTMTLTTIQEVDA